jgi:ProP effector
MHEGIAQLAELYPSCFCQPRRPLKIGIHNDIIARHPELRPGVIASALKTYTRSLCYLETLKAGSARIDLEGNAVGAVTEADEEDAQRKIAKAARRAAAKTIEDRKAAAAPPMTQRVSQVEQPQSKSATIADLPSGPAAPAPQPTAPTGPPRVGLAGLKAAAQGRRAMLVAAKKKP